MPAILNLPASFDDDLLRFKEETDRFQHGAVSAAEYRSFRVPRGVYEQREADTYMLRARCPAGAVLPHQLRALAAVSRRYGNGVLHVTTRQDIQVHRVLLGDLHPALTELHAAGVSTRGGGGNTVRNITGCYDAGVCAAEAFDISPYVVALTESLLPDPLSYHCKLGICLSRGLARAVADELASSGADLESARDLRIHISGCPNSCGRHAIADIGLHGVARRVHDRLVPHDVLQVGGRVAEGETRFAEGSQAIPAKRLPALLRELLSDFAASQAPSFRAYLDAGGRQAVDALTERYKQVPDFESGQEYYRDWGAETLFSLAGRGPGECGAGVFDLQRAQGRTPSRVHHADGGSLASGDSESLSLETIDR